MLLADSTLSPGIPLRNVLVAQPLFDLPIGRSEQGNSADWFKNRLRIRTAWNTSMTTTPLEGQAHVVISGTTLDTQALSFAERGDSVRHHWIDHPSNPDVRWDGIPRSMAGKSLAGFRTTQSRRITVLYDMEIAFHKPTITSTVDGKPTTAWEESGFPSEFLALLALGRTASPHAAVVSVSVVVSVNTLRLLAEARTERAVSVLQYRLDRVTRTEQ